MRSDNWLLTPVAHWRAWFTWSVVAVVCFVHQAQPVKLRGPLTGVWLGAKNEEEMNYMAPSRSPADSISAESQLHGCVCVNALPINISPNPSPPLQPTPMGPLWWWWRKDVAVWVIECCWSWPWAHPCALSPSGRPTAECWPEGTSLKASSRTAAGCASPSVSDRRTPTWCNSFIRYYRSRQWKVFN